uniref:MscS Mechanosensitive ion channel n=1 Tax=Solibacter usitatus (strain Ellin6076) TaxID=234267 RepID=Q027P0_SOLUE
MKLRACLTGLLLCARLGAQLTLSAPAPAAAPVEAPKDALGRTTPRGTVKGFLEAGHKGNLQVAAQYLNTRLRGAHAERLAEQLFSVLNRRLPARLMELSDKPEGSLTDLKGDQDLVGTIASAQGDLEIVVERVSRGKEAPLWLFSSQTLEKIPALFDEVNAVPIDSLLPPILVKTTVGGIALFEWLGLLVGLPAAYLVTVLLNRALSGLAGAVRRRLRKDPGLPDPEILPAPIRLLMVAAAISWVRSAVFLPLLARQFWTSVASVLTIAAVAWLIIVFNGGLEQWLRRRLLRAGCVGATSVIRLGRRMLDVLIVFIGLLVAFYHFGWNPTAALAGLGVGGVAVALAAQRTLENVIGGISIIFDQVVRVGDTLRVGETSGIVDDVGLRSTRLRTNDRTVVSVPNGQIANLSLENLSARDKFWLHPTVSLRCDTTVEQLRSVVEGLHDLLARDLRVEQDSVRVRFLRLGPNSLDVEVFAYVRAKEWNHFLDIQGEILLGCMECVQTAGARLAIPSALYLEAVGKAELDLMHPTPTPR